MTKGFSFDVFLSHSSKDKAIVRVIAERLRTDGLRVWLDEWEIRPGDSIPAKIEDGLERSRVLVLCMSAHALGSEWAQLEAGTFRFRDPLNKERRFIPLRLDKATIKGSLAQFQYINWQPADRDQAYPKLLEASRPPAKMTEAEVEVASKQILERFIQLDTESEIYAYAFSPDGKRALTGADDKTVRLWNLEAGRCVRVLDGHKGRIMSVAWSADQRHALSGSNDGTVRLWDLDTGRCVGVLAGGHAGAVLCVAWGPDQRSALSSSEDHTICLWDLKSLKLQRLLSLLQGHRGAVWSVVCSADGRRALSGADDNSIRMWDLNTGTCLRELTGHTSYIWRAVWSADERRALSCSIDKTVRLWDMETGRCLRVLEGHTGEVRSVVWSADELRALSCSNDGTVRLWGLGTGSCLFVFKGHTVVVHGLAWSVDGRHAFSGDIHGGVCVWNLSGSITVARAPTVPARPLPPAPDQVQYTNAKVLLVGESGAGKTGLTMRLAHDRFNASISTAGAWSTQWLLKDLPQKPGWEREVWLWDFGGQADQRLIHQLYFDHTTLVLLMFNSDREIVLPGLREWQQALAQSMAHDARTLLVAGRTDVGLRFDREKVRTFARENGCEYFETSAQTDSGIPELRKAVVERIPWNELPVHNSPALFKRLKDEILKLRDEGQVLTTLKELESVLRHRLPSEIKFADPQLETVVSLLDGPAW